MVTKLPKRFTDSVAAREHLEALRWNGNPYCPHCEAQDCARPVSGGRAGLWRCGACKKQYTVTVGTVFERSKIPLNTWVYATYLICSSKKGISGHQLARMLGVTYKTAWFMAHRIREAMRPILEEEPLLGGAGKIVEADEAYIGRKAGSKGQKRPGAGGYGHKRTVLSLVERGGKIRSFKLGAPSQYEIKSAIRQNVDPASTLHTDGAQVYKGSKVTDTHEAVDHNKAYVRWDVHVNTLEGFFSVFKRGMIGTYQHCGEQHLQRYLAEFDFRMNHRAKLGYSDDMRTDKALAGIVGKRLTYRKTKAEVL